MRVLWVNFVFKEINNFNIRMNVSVCPQIVVMLKIKKLKFENEKVNCSQQTIEVLKLERGFARS